MRQGLPTKGGWQGWKNPFWVARLAPGLGLAQEEGFKNAVLEA
jgi:hypothetical protein